MKTYIEILFIIIVATSCRQKCTCESIVQNDIDGKIRYKICKYLKNNDKIAEPANPCEWKINEQRSSFFQGKEVEIIKMDCCFTGDELIIDKKSKDVIGYFPSDK
jgi:hypothetical protein